MIKLSKERLRAALPRLTPAEQDELLTLLEQERVEVETTEARWTEIEATRPPLESFIPSLTEIARAHYERREMHLKKLLRDSQPPADNIDEALEYWFSLREHDQSDTTLRQVALDCQQLSSAARQTIRLGDHQDVTLAHEVDGRREAGHAQPHQQAHADHPCRRRDVGT